MQRKLLGIINVDFHKTGQPLIIYSAFIKYLKKMKEREYSEAGHRLFIDFKKAYESVRREVFYNILFEFGIPMKLVRVIKMFPVRNGLKQRDAVLPFFFNLALEYAKRKIQVNHYGLKLNLTNQLLFYGEVVYIL
jgi:hypothetical protein